MGPSKEGWMYLGINSSSLALLGIAAVIWIVLWIVNARGRLPARYFTALVFIACNIAFTSMNLFFSYRLSQLDSWLDRPDIPHWYYTVRNTSDSMQVFCLGAFVFFWLAVLKRQVLGWVHVMLCLVGAAVVAYLLHQASSMIQSRDDYSNSSGLSPWRILDKLIILGVPASVLGLTLVLDVYCIYRSIRKARTRTRDQKVVLWTSMATIPLVIYAASNRAMYLVYFLFLDNLAYIGLLEALHIMTGLYGLVIFLVFVVLNVELLSLTPCLRSLLDCEDNQQNHFKDAADKPFTESEDPLTHDVIGDEWAAVSEMRPMSSTC